MSPISKLPPFDRASRDLNVIIDTPKGNRNKFSWDEKGEIFELSGTLPAGAVFPYDFGFIPNTRGGDGDPLDVLILMDEPAFTGCLVRCRLLGVIEAEQTEEGETNRNDRLIAVASNSRTNSDLKSIEDLNPKLVDEIEHFFVSYNAAKGKRFKPLGRYGPDTARKLVQRSKWKNGGSGHLATAGPSVACHAFEAAQCPPVTVYPSFRRSSASSSSIWSAAS